MTALLLALLAPAWAGTVEGVVRERGSAAPVPDAFVDVGGVVIEVDERGRFAVELPDGEPSALRVGSPRHRLQEITVTPPLDEPLAVWLLPAPSNEIVVEAFRPTAELSRHRVDAELAWETPGTYDDAVRVVASLPSVTVQREFGPGSGDIAVRGAGAGDNRVYVDGIEIPYLYHFNQYASVVPASQLDTLDLYPSGFGARYGDAVGGIIEATTRADRPRDVEGAVALNLVTVGADVRVPLPKGWWVGVAGRRSFHDLAGRTSTQYPVWPVFYDATVRAGQERPDGSRFGLWVSAAGDGYERRVGELDVLDPFEQTEAPALDFGRHFQVGGFSYHWARGRVVAAVVHDHVSAELDRARGRLVQDEVRFPIRLDTEGRFDDRLSWEAGAEVRPELLFATVEDAGPAGALVASEAPPLAWGTATSGTIARSRLAAYGVLHAQLGPVRLMPGVRLGYDTAGHDVGVEPRLAVRARVADATELRFGGGLYRQRPQSVQLLADADLPTTNAWVVTGGVDQAIGGRFELSLEGYGKWLRDVIWQPVDGPPAVADRGTAYGVELTARYRLRDTLFLWAWVAWGRSFLVSSDERFPSGSDQPWSGGLVASYDPIPALQLAVRYRLASGLPFTDVVDSAYEAAEDTWVPRFGPPHGDRMPLYQKIDARVAYTFFFRRWSLAIAADVWIVPPSAAPLYPAWSWDWRERTFVRGPVVLPLVGLRATF